MARLPRQRDDAPTPRTPARPARGLSKGMLVVLIMTGLVAVLSIYIGKCGVNRGKPTKARTHWNAPKSKSARTASLDDLRAQAETRAHLTVPDGRLARMSGRRIDATGHVDLDYGAAGFEFVAPAGSTPCGVEEGVARQGWTQRPRSACNQVPLELRCTYAAAVQRAFPTPPAALQFVVESADAGAVWTFWSLDADEAPPVTVPDDC